MFYWWTFSGLFNHAHFLSFANHIIFITWTQLSHFCLLWLVLTHFRRAGKLQWNWNRDLLECSWAMKEQNLSINIFLWEYIYSTVRNLLDPSTTCAWRCPCIGCLWLWFSGSFSPEPFGFSSSNVPISINEFYCLIFLGLPHTFQVVHLSVSVAGQVN